MKNIETCNLTTMMDSASPPSLKEKEDISNEQPLEKTSVKIDSSVKKIENGHNEDSVAEKDSSSPIKNGNESNPENGKTDDSKEHSENGVKDTEEKENGSKESKSPVQDTAIDSELSDLAKVVDVDMKDSDSEDVPEMTEAKSEKSEKTEKTETVSESKSEERSEKESSPETEAKSNPQSKTETESKSDKSDNGTNTEAEAEVKPAEDEKMETDENSPKKGEICLEPANSQTESDASDSEEDSKAKSKSDSDSKTESNSKSESDSEEKKEESKEKEEEAPKPEKDYKAALDDLTTIAENAKKINDVDLLVKKSEGGALKRTSSSNEEKSEVEPKKMKLEQSPVKEEEGLVRVKSDLKDVKNIKTSIKMLTREQLEDMVTLKISECLSARSEIGMLRRKCDSFEEECEKWKKKQQLLQKMCSDLTTVMKRYITDEQNKPKDRVTPIRITRSVGLQVMTDRNRRPQQQGSQQVATKTTPAPVTNKSSASNTLQNIKPVTIATPTTMVVPRPVAAPIKPVMATPAPIATPTVNKTVAQNISKLPPSVSIIQTPSANTATSQAASTQQQPHSTTASTASKKVIECVDLSDDEDQAPKQPKPNTTTSPASVNGLRMIPVAQLRGNNAVITPVKKAPTFNNIISATNVVRVATHPAPLPNPPRAQPNGALPPKPTLKLSRLQTGIVLSWNMTMKTGTNIANYQIYAYQETSHQKPEAILWKKVGDVKALPLPMACTLTQFQKGNKYHFAVRAKDQHQRVGFFSDPQSIALT